jgi:formylglycine-generating enzyme required for sulfatase activity
VAEGAMPPADVPAEDPFVETLGAGLTGRLPVLLRLREFWEFLPARVGAALTVSDVETAFVRWVDANAPAGLDASLVLAHLEWGSMLLILDGMDEVPVSAPTASGKWHPRQQLLAALAEGCHKWCRTGNRVLLTSRPYGLTEDEAHRTTLQPAPLRPLTYELQMLLARRWFAVLSGDKEVAAVTAGDLFANIRSQPWLVELAASPLLLTAMCIVYDEGRRLPHDKHELYERVVSTVLFSRYQDPADLDKARRYLGVIAYGMHTGGLDAGRQTPRAEATFHEVDQWLRAYQANQAFTERADASAAEARDALLSDSGLLVSAGPERVAFAHLSFQEFFAAQRSFSVDEATLGDLFRTRAAMPEWRNTLSFLFGRIVASFPEPQKGIDLLETLLATATMLDGGLLQALADAALILKGKGTSLRSATQEELAALLVEAMTSTGGFKARVELGSSLGRLGDPRFRPDRLWLPDDDLLGFVGVPSGPFIMGGDAKRDTQAQADEHPQHLVTLPEFFVAQYPVTVAQFRAFVEDAGYTVGDPGCLHGVPNYPAVSVSFQEALDYCAWLTSTLRVAEWTPPTLRKALVDGHTIILPSEAEWEKAARGLDGSIYPSGDHNDSWWVLAAESSQGTEPVGISTSASPYGCFDMGTNVFEWTRSRWASYPYPDNPGERESLSTVKDELRVLRGSTLSEDPSKRRAAARHRLQPDERRAVVGFRLVVSRLRP